MLTAKGLAVIQVRRLPGNLIESSSNHFASGNNQIERSVGRQQAKCYCDLGEMSKH
jgi:hypothetical protein